MPVKFRRTKQCLRKNVPERQAEIVTSTRLQPRIFPGTAGSHTACSEWQRKMRTPFRGCWEREEPKDFLHRANSRKAKRRDPVLLSRVFNAADAVPLKRQGFDFSNKPREQIQILKSTAASRDPQEAAVLFLVFGKFPVFSCFAYKTLFRQKKA